ncbi:NADH-ubiquinone oxidoreductase [Penicillium ucsense]|uniref:NADH-ubiquinone oxidoreductase n=2 Tax=Penicillium TaxID=5073 RepID=A0A8J8WFV0_9EURO|nr:NADH-ubiquinone oxidoreductase [Penicillium diatomitis]KAF7712940.1 NADH-ubiquinone oxidoreductase [Penicillium ucsense]KAF7731033.1 NADH-ubiquinone oxidoreductase [Penicillium ucsense]KAJ5480982.1 NADH-ubiquinone oxidoreductase [Penicillium diatomitis]
MASDHSAVVVPPKQVATDYPLIDSDPHMRRVFRYARREDYAVAGATGAISPIAFWVMERVSPSHVGRGGFPPVMRLATAIGFIGGLHVLYQRSCNRFYGFTENSREVDMDMREMVDKVKKGEPLYGTSGMSSYLQGVAARNSRYSGLFVHVLPWFNIVNHDQHGVDTAKYYQQAERELEAERLSRA